MKFVTKRIHAFLDYPVAIALIVLPFLLGLGDSSPLALQLSVATGIAAFILTLTEDELFDSPYKDGSKILFLADKNLLTIKKIDNETLEILTKPLRKAKKKMPQNWCITSLLYLLSYNFICYMKI